VLAVDDLKRRVQMEIVPMIATERAVNDALRPLGITINTLPLKVSKLGDLIAEAWAK